MEKSLSNLSVPVFTVRPATLADCSAVARIQVDSYRGAYAALTPAKYIDSFSYSEQEQEWKDWLQAGQGLLLVAESERGTITGYALTLPLLDENRSFDCEVIALYVNQVFHRQGAGRALMADAARRMRLQGCHSLGLWVMEGNPAASFYERLGGQPCGEHFFEIEELHLRERIVGYVWPNIETLFQ
jgi:GNAT superfamily N-acetyltransferase